MPGFPSTCRGLGDVGKPCPSALPRPGGSMCPIQTAISLAFPWHGDQPTWTWTAGFASDKMTNGL